jgi:hypothetical protein
MRGVPNPLDGDFGEVLRLKPCETAFFKVAVPKLEVLE